MVNNSNYFSDKEDGKFKDNDMSHLLVMDNNTMVNIEKFKLLRESVIKFLGISRYLHTIGCFEVGYEFTSEFKHVVDFFSIDDYSISKNFIEVKELSDLELLEVYKQVYTLILKEDNSTGIFSINESFMYLEFKKKAYCSYLEGSVNIKNRFGIKFSKQIYLVKKLADKGFTGISDLIDTKLIDEIPTLDVSDELKRFSNSYLSTIKLRDAYDIISNLVNTMMTVDYKKSEFNTSKSRELKETLKSILDSR